MTGSCALTIVQVINAVLKMKRNDFQRLASGRPSKVSPNINIVLSFTFPDLFGVHGPSKTYLRLQVNIRDEYTDYNAIEHLSARISCPCDHQGMRQIKNAK